MRPFRFGVRMDSPGHPDDWADRARAAERHGYSTLLMPDHLTGTFPPFLTLASAAAVTTRVRVGTLVLNNDLRHPVLTANEAAALDRLSAGRFELGVGAGHNRAEYDAAGLAFDRVSVRVERLAEGTFILKRLLEGEPVTWRGRHYRLDGCEVYPRPVQSPRPPLLIGGNGRRVLSLAAREADIIGLIGFSRTDDQELDTSAFTAAGTDVRVGWVQQAAGDRLAGLELNALVQHVTITDDLEKAAASLPQERGDPELSTAELLESPYLLLGPVEKLVEDLRARRERFGISYWVVREAAMEAFAPVVAQLTGT